MLPDNPNRLRESLTSFRLLFVFVVFANAVNGNAQEPSTNISEIPAPSDSYLLGMVAMGHVVVLHDHVTLLVEQGKQEEQKPGIVRRLTDLSAYCARLEQAFDRRPKRNRTPDELGTLFRLLRQECDSARASIAEPTAGNLDGYNSSRTALANKLKDIGERKSP